MTVISYLVHDTADAAVARRVRMFQAGGAEVRLGGFNRRGPPAEVAGVTVCDLGQTADAKLARRAITVARHLVRPAAAQSIVCGTDVIIARNLEMLALAARVAARGQRIVFECLDIHRLLLADSPTGRVLRSLERRLLQRVDLILTSSPAFEQRYFRERQRLDGPILIEENRLLQIENTRISRVPAAIRPTGGPPWRIGWFGMLRCRRTLDMLRRLVRDNPGLVEVTIAGVPSHVEFDDFDRDVAGVAGLSFVGRYTADELPRLYGSVDFAWAIDYFEEGLNSTWLLPNRLYESLASGAVPLALADVETGRWLRAKSVGLCLKDPQAELAPLLQRLTPTRFDELRRAVTALPRHLIVANDDDCRVLTAAVVGSPAP